MCTESQIYTKKALFVDGLQHLAEPSKTRTGHFYLTFLKFQTKRTKNKEMREKYSQNRCLDVQKPILR
jgi:hypothetical protein